MSSTHIHILTTALFSTVGPNINIGVIVDPVLGASRRPARSGWATTVLLPLVEEETDTCGRSSSSRARQAGKEDRGAAGGEVGEIRIAPPSQSVRGVRFSAEAGCVAGLVRGGGTGCVGCGCGEVGGRGRV
jgi:hypothetical protein